MSIYAHSIYVDGVINHMTGGGSGFGSDGSSFNGDTEVYPGVPFGNSDFHGAAECPTSNLEIQVKMKRSRRPRVDKSIIHVILQRTTLYYVIHDTLSVVSSKCSLQYPMHCMYISFCYRPSNAIGNSTEK